LSFDERDDTKEFIGVSAVTENQDEILPGDHPEVAVDGVHRIQSDRGGSGARKGGCDFMTDMPRFSDSRDDDFAPVFQSLLHQTNRLEKRRAQSATNATESRDFDIEDPSCLLDGATCGHKEKEYASCSRWATRMKA
jgi:hypothetical protein